MHEYSHFRVQCKTCTALQKATATSKSFAKLSYRNTSISVLKSSRLHRFLIEMTSVKIVLDLKKSDPPTK